MFLLLYRIVLTLFFLGYSVLGGLVSALIVNLIQGMFILVLSFLLIPFALNAIGGMEAAKATLPEHMFSFIAPTEVTLYFIIAIIINGLIGVVVQPHHMAVGGAGKTESACRAGWTYGNFTKRFATLGWALVGVLAAALFPGLENEYWQHKHECIRVTYAQDDAVVAEGVKIIADEIKKLYAEA